jgi:hypothetical protein
MQSLAAAPLASLLLPRSCFATAARLASSSSAAAAAGRRWGARGVSFFAPGQHLRHQHRERRLLK